MFLEHLHKNPFAVVIGVIVAFPPPLSAGHIEQRFSILFRHHGVMLHCWLHGRVFRNDVSFLYTRRVPSGVYSSYKVQYCVSYSTQNTVHGTCFDGRKTLGDAGFRHIESLCLGGLVFPARPFRPVCERRPHPRATSNWHCKLRTPPSQARPARWRYLPNT